MATILLCGGGTGGHILPLLAVAKELKHRAPDIKLVYVGDKSSRFKGLVGDELFDDTRHISAGKFRRYHRQNWLARALDVNTLALNARDSVRFARGIIEARRLLKKLRPDVVFIKGGFVGVPVGLAAARLKIPYITHDSDALPGLANRLIAKSAAMHATGLPEHYYAYPREKTHFVGVPVRSEFRAVGKKLQAKYRSDLKIPSQAKVLLIVGGSLGAVRMNNFVVQIVPRLLENFPDLIIAHSTGVVSTDLYASLGPKLRERIIEQHFFDPIYKYSGAADVIITRAGATAMAEFALQAKPCIIIPNPQLTGGHQSKNAQVYAEANAALVISEEQLKKEGADKLLAAVIKLLSDKQTREALSKHMAKFAKVDSTHELADLILHELHKVKQGK